MFTSLRARLWLTYAVLILLILGILAGGVFVYVLRNPLIDRQALLRLDASLAVIQRQLNDRAFELRDLDTLFSRFSEAFSVRLILYTSQGKLIQDSNPESPEIPWSTTLKTRGQIQDLGGATWLYSSWQMPTRETLLLASPRQGGLQLLRSPQLRETLREDFLPAFFRTGLVAFILAVVFAAWMGSWIAKPLQEIEKASRSLTRGEYHRIPPRGPDEVRALAGAYNDMVGQVQASQQSQKDFVANVSHELKTPLTSISGFSQAILDGTASSGQALQKAAGIIQTEADRMYRLVVDLLDLARFDAGTVELERDSVDLPQLLTHVVDQLLPQAAEARVRIKLDLNPLPTVVGDRDRLAQVFTNLVDNAVKHSPAEGQVQVQASAVESSVLIQVVDRGKGIPAEHVERIFERFYKVDGSRTGAGKPGTGLGLAIAQQIVEAHEGEIRVRSQPGEGTVFEVWLPVVKPDDRTIAVNWGEQR